MIGIFIALAALIGVGGTVTVADNARPGNTLFGIDQAVENVRLSLSGDEKKNELRIRFAEERLEEVKDIKAEKEKEDDDSEEVDGENEESDAEIKIGLEAALNLITDVNKAGGEEDPRLTALAAELSAYMNALPENARVEISDDRFRIKFDQGPEKIQIKEQGDNKTKIDVRTDEGRFKIEVRDGQIEIKTKTEDPDSDDDLKDELEAEAKILSDKTVIEVEIKDQKVTFSSTATTEADIVAAIVARFPELTSAQVSAVLEIETEDEGGGDESDDKEDDADEEDEDEDDDNLSDSNSDIDD